MNRDRQTLVQIIELARPSEPAISCRPNRPLLRHKCGVERNGFTIRIRQDQLLRARTHRRDRDRQRIHISERNSRGLAAHGRFDAVLEAATANRDASASGGRTTRRIERPNAEGHVRELYHSEPTRGEREQALPILVGGQELAVDPSVSVLSMANGSGRYTRSRSWPLCASRMSIPP